MLEYQSHHNEAFYPILLSGGARGNDKSFYFNDFNWWDLFKYLTDWIMIAGNHVENV